MHRREAPGNVLGALGIYIALLAVDVLVLPFSKLPFAWGMRGAAIAGLALTFALTRTQHLRAIRPALPLAVSWIGTLHSAIVGAEVGGNAGIVYRYFVVLLLALPPLIGRATVREAIVCTVGSFALFQTVELWRGGDDPVVWVFLTATCAIAGIYGVYGAWIYHSTTHHDFWQTKVIEWQVSEIAAERARSDELLRNMLPEAIANRLKAGDGVIADQLEGVTVAFADLVGFTDYAARTSAAEVVARLDAIFRRFDALAATYGLEKIKTIGDAYMVAGGVPEPDADHAANVARFALALQGALDAIHAETGDAFRVRVGVHTGPAVAGVIGERKLAYDLWGDTVNTASRMESHGEPGRIQLTAAARAALGDAFVVEERGLVEVKGKGAMTTYWLVAEAAGSDSVA